jgi:hypothetical protein
VDSWQEGPSLGASNGAVAFSPDGKLVAVETGQNTVRLLDPNTGREYARLEDPNQDRAGHITFSPDGTQLVVTGERQSLHVWDLRAIREELAQRHLDWELPPFPPAAETPTTPLRVTVDLGDLADPRLDVAISTAALALLPAHPEAWLRRGHAWYRLQDYRRAADDLGVALSFGLGDQGAAPGLAGGGAQAWFEWGTACYYCGRLGPVAAAYGRCVELDPENALYRNCLAWSLATSPDATLRNPKHAVELARRAVDLTPHDGNSWNTLGVAYYRAESWKEAIEALQKSTKLQQGGTAFDFFFLAMAHHKLGNGQEARRCYDQALAWIEKNCTGLDRSPTQAQELRRFRTEAEDVLGISKD